MSKVKSCAKSQLMEDGGIVKGYASTFDREPDAYGRYIPLLWGHDTDNPESNIGRVINAYEDERGLFIEAEYDKDNPRAQYVRKLVNEGRVYQFSFAYEVKDWATVTLEDGTKANELREIELFEVSVVQIPANAHATVEESKDAPVIGHAVVEIVPVIKAGRRNSAKDSEVLEEIAEHAAAIQEDVSSLLADNQATVSDSEREAQAEGAKEQAEFVEAYKQALLTIYKE